jgi:disease resistance protein RPS2
MLQRLEFEEAWNLFDANAGCNRVTNSSAQIRVYAKSIVNMCGGLPLALKIVGQAMASKESEHEWKHVMWGKMFQRRRKSAPDPQVLAPRRDAPGV